MREVNDNYLVENGERYRGTYVTLSGPDSKEVISSSKSAVHAFNMAKEAGYESPILIYVPNTPQILNIR